MISYEPLWETMRKKQISTYRLMVSYGVSRSQIARMKKGLHVSTYTIERFCKILDCRIEDVVEITVE